MYLSATSLWEGAQVLEGVPGSRKFARVPIMDNNVFYFCPQNLNTFHASCVMMNVYTFVEDYLLENLNKKKCLSQFT